LTWVHLWYLMMKRGKIKGKWELTKVENNLKDLFRPNFPWKGGFGGVECHGVGNNLKSHLFPFLSRTPKAEKFTEG
jgi:hypothetical protein